MAVSDRLCWRPIQANTPSEKPRTVWGWLSTKLAMNFLLKEQLAHRVAVKDLTLSDLVFAIDALLPTPRIRQKLLFNIVI
jgi:hypothetical protein